MGCAVQGSGDRDASALASLRGVRSDGPLHSLQEWIALSGCPALGTRTRSAARIMRGGSEQCEQAAVPERWERAPPIHAASSRPPACTPRALAQLPCPAHDCGGVMHGEVLPVLPWSRPGKRSRRLLHAAHREASLGRGTSGLRDERTRTPRGRGEGDRVYCVFAVPCIQSGKTYYIVNSS